MFNQIHNQMVSLLIQVTTKLILKRIPIPLCRLMYQNNLESYLGFLVMVYCVM